MSNLSIDFGGFYISKDKWPSQSFKRLLSEKLGSILCKMVDNENEQQVFDTVCLCFDDDLTYFNPLEDDDGHRYIRVSVRHKSSWMGIGHAYVVFSANGVMMIPWEKAIPENICDIFLGIPKDQQRNIKTILPELYRTVVKREQSGLPFDYEIKNTGDGVLTITCNPNILEKEMLEICSTIECFIESYNQNHMDIPIHYYERLKSKNQSIRYKIDLGAVNADDLKNCIITLKNFKIKKVVFS